MYQLTEANLNQISAWFIQDLPCKNGISIIDLIKMLSDDNMQPELVIADVPTVEATVTTDVEIL
jgi:hypothetical protein